MYREADGPDDMRKAVREQLRAGADFIKVMTTGARSNEMEDPDPVQLTGPEFSALVDEAHRMGVKVAAHVEGLDGTAAAIGHGMDTIEHGMYLNQRPDLLEQMAARGQVLVPTLSGYYWMGGLATRSTRPPRAFDAKCCPASSNSPTTTWSRGPSVCEPPVEAGVRIALGSDGETVSGQDTALEFVRMVHHGLSPVRSSAINHFGRR